MIPDGTSPWERYMAATPPVDPIAFHAFELTGWEQAANPYAEYWGKLTGQSAGPLLDAIGVGPGVHMLDVATGPGFVARIAARRGAHVTALDFSSAMVALARQGTNALHVVAADAEALPFGDATFEAVAMNYGMLHLARPEQAMREAFRVLQSGGRFGFTVWAPPDEAVTFGIVLGAIQRLGDPNVAVPPGPPFFRYSDPSTSRQELEAAGFARPELRQVPQTWRLDNAAAAFDAMYQGTARTAGLLRRQTAEELQAIRAAIIDQLESFSVDGGIELPMPAVLAFATKP